VRSSGFGTGAVAESLPSGLLERDPSALFRRLLDGVLVLGAQATVPSRITRPGEAVWAAFAEPSTLASVTAALSTRFAAPLAVVRADIEPVVRLLLDTGALRVPGTPLPEADGGDP
jgi:hypothetical protein